jgi:Bacterial Ig-like domain (group 2)
MTRSSGARGLRGGLCLLIALAGIRCSDKSPIGPGPVVAVRMVPDTLTLDPGQGFQVRAFPIDADTAFLPNKTPTWATDDGTIVGVDDTGFVTGVGLGSTDVTATVDGIVGRTHVMVSPPDIALEFDTLTFTGSELGTDPAAQSLQVHTRRLVEVTGLAVGTIVYQAGASGWLQASLDQATSPATLLVSVRTGSLVAGTYRAQVPITSTNAGNSPATLEVVFVVGAGPTIGLSPGAVDLFAVPGGADPGPVAVQVTNAGGGTLSGLGVGPVVYGVGASGWIASATLDATDAPATLTIQGTVGSLVGGTYTADIPIVSSGAVNSPQSVIVTFTVTNQATIQLSSPTADISAAHLAADPAPDVITITNGSGGTLSGLTTSTAYGPGASGWLTPTLDATTAPANLSLQAATSGLAPGTYTATVTVTSPVAVNSPTAIAVTLRVLTSLAGDVQPILAGCTACHDGGTAFQLPNPWPHNQLVGAPGCNNGTNTDTILVVPGDPNLSYLYRLLAGTTQCNTVGYTQMPPGGGLPQADQDIVRQWIIEGALDN